MNLASLLLHLKQLLAAAEPDWDEIAELLAEHDYLAEFEVARHLVQGSAEPRVRELVASIDPRERFKGARMVGLTFTRSGAGKILRHLVKDPDQATRAQARAMVRRLGVEDVALRDTRLPQPRYAPGAGGYNPTGWNFGQIIYWGRVSQPKKPKVKGLRRLADPDAVAKLCGYGSADELVRFTRPGCGEGAPYVEFEIPKRSGGMRRISAPRMPLRRLQRTILDEVVSRIPLHEAAHGFVPGRSTVTNARPHAGAAGVVKMDVRDFFPSIHYRRVAGLFGYYRYSEEVAALLAALTTHRPVLPDGTVVWPGALPQGAPTSPALANVICRRMDARLSGLCAKVGATYTRYADDLTFSFAEEPQVPLGRFIWWVDQICQQEGFAEKPTKRRVLRRSKQQLVTGIVVNSGLHVPREARRRFRAILHNCREHGVASQARGKEDFADYLRGFAAYVKMVQPEAGAKLVAEVDEILA